MNFSIYVPKDIIELEYNRFNIEIFEKFKLGNNIIDITLKNLNSTTAHYEYCSLFYLYCKNMSLQVYCSVDIFAIKKFMTYIYGINTIIRCKNKEDLEYMYDRTIKTTDKKPETTKQEDIDNIHLLCKTTNLDNVRIESEEFGILTAPSTEDVQNWLNNVKYIPSSRTLEWSYNTMCYTFNLHNC